MSESWWHKEQSPFHQYSSGKLVGVSALCFLQFFDIAGTVAGMTPGAQEHLCCLPQMFSAGTNGQRKLNQNLLTQVHIKKTASKMGYSLPWLHTKFSEHALSHASTAILNALPDNIHTMADS